VNAVLLPRTDVGVLVQLVVVAVGWGAMLWALPARPTSRLVVVGIGLVTFALMALRAAH
jgi:hypothetical protein